MNILGRTDVERIVEMMLNNLQIEVRDEGDTKIVVLLYENSVLSKTEFSIK